MVYFNFKNTMHSLSIHCSLKVPHYRKYWWSIFGRLGFLFQHSEIKRLESLLISYHHTNPRMPFIPASQLTDAVDCSKKPMAYQGKGTLTDKTITYSLYCNWGMVADILYYSQV